MGDKGRRSDADACETVVGWSEERGGEATSGGASSFRGVQLEEGRHDVESTVGDVDDVGSLICRLGNDFLRVSEDSPSLISVPVAVPLSSPSMLTIRL